MLIVQFIPLHNIAAFINIWKWKCVNFKCYSSEELITLNTLHEVVPTWYSFHSWVDWSNADKVSCSRRKHIDAGIEPATFESKVDILTPTPMVHNVDMSIFDSMLLNFAYPCRNWTFQHFEMAALKNGRKGIKQTNLTLFRSRTQVLGISSADALPVSHGCQWWNWIFVL